LVNRRRIGGGGNETTAAAVSDASMGLCGRAGLPRSLSGTRWLWPVGAAVREVGARNLQSPKIFTSNCAPIQHF
jgi:hypothetical protein